MAKNKNRGREDSLSPKRNSLGKLVKRMVGINRPPLTISASDLRPPSNAQKKPPPITTGKEVSRSPRNRWILSAVLSFVLVSIGSSCMFFYATKTATKTLSATISHTGEVELIYKYPQSSGISPLCGCYAPQEVDKWRGITFAARTLTLEREADLTSPRPADWRETPRTAFYITSPLPGRVDNVSTYLKFKADLYVIEMAPQDVFDPDQFVKGGYVDARVIRRQSLDETEFLQLVGSDKVNIHLMGEKALAAWIPARDSLVSIGSLPRQFPAGKSVAFLSERYFRPPSRYLENGEHLIEDTDLPLGDFIASMMILWTEEPATILSEQGALGPLSKRLTSDKIITLAVVQPPFSIRIACQPWSEELLSQVLARKPGLREGDSNEKALFAERDAGRVLLTIIDPEGQAREYDRIYDQLEKNDLIRAPVILDTSVASGPNRLRQWATAEMDFRYPPVPRYAGFNIFGSLSMMRMENALGTLQVGNKIYPLNVPSQLALNKIEAFRVQGGTISFPVQLDFDREAAIIHVQATSKVLVNGDPLSNQLDDLRPFFVYLVLTAIGTLTGLAGLVISLAKLRRK